jgi:hypothetical protein
MRLKIDIEDSEKRLSQLRKTATSRADLVIQFGNWLKNSPELHIYRDGYSIIHGQPVHQIRMLTDRDVEALEIKPSLAIADEIRQEIAVLAKLKERLSRS